MKAYILRRDLLPDGVDLEAILDMSQGAIIDELFRQRKTLLNRGEHDEFLAWYEQGELEDLISLDEGAFDPQKYYLRIFPD
jgi:hypothetical protein